MTLNASAYIDDATYWPAPTETGFGGEEFGAPQLIKTKWEYSVEEFVDNTGAVTHSRAIVYILGLSIDEIDEGGYLVLGDYVTVPVTDPTTVRKAYPIRRVDMTRDLRGLDEEIRAYL